MNRTAADVQHQNCDKIRTLTDAENKGKRNRRPIAYAPQGITIGEQGTISCMRGVRLLPFSLVSHGSHFPRSRHELARARPAAAVKLKNSAAISQLALDAGGGVSRGRAIIDAALAQPIRSSLSCRHSSETLSALCSSIHAARARRVGRCGQGRVQEESRRAIGQQPAVAPSTCCSIRLSDVVTVSTRKLLKPHASAKRFCSRACRSRR